MVFDNEGAQRSLYRRFNIKDIQPGDDYAAMYQAIKRRYTKLKQQGSYLPDMLMNRWWQRAVEAGCFGHGGVAAERHCAARGVQKDVSESRVRNDSLCWELYSSYSFV